MEDTDGSGKIPIAHRVNEVFDYWRVRFGHTRARLDKKRAQKIRQRLLDGYEVRDLIDAVDGCALSPFHMGDNPGGVHYDDIELICRDAKHVDQFVKLKEQAAALHAQKQAAEKAKREEAERLDAERRARQGGDSPMRQVLARRQIGGGDGRG